MERTNQIDFTGSRVKLQDLITSKLNENSYEDKTFLKIMDDQTLKVRIHQETESTRVGSQVRALRVSDFYVGCEGYMGQHFTWVIIFTWVAWVKIFFCVGQFFYVVQNFMRESKFFTWSKFWLDSFLEGGSKEISIDAFTSIFRIFLSSTLCSSRKARSKSKLK